MTKTWYNTFLSHSATVKHITYLTATSMLTRQTARMYALYHRFLIKRFAYTQVLPACPNQHSTVDAAHRTYSSLQSATVA